MQIGWKKYNSNQQWNNNKCLCECKKLHVYEKDYIWNVDTCSFQNEKYLASIIDDSTIIFAEITEPFNKITKTIPTNFIDKKSTCQTQRFYVSLAFFLITVVLLIDISIYCYLIKYRAKQNHLLPFHITNDKLKQVLYQ